MGHKHTGALIMLALALLAISAPLASAQSTCDAVIPTVPTLDVERDAGTWYEILASRWIRSTLEVDANNSTFVGVRNVCYRGGVVESPIEGTATQLNPDTAPGELFVSFGFGETEEANYFIQEVDYDSYVLVGSGPCFDDSNRSLWLLARQPDFLERFPGRAEEILELATRNGFKLDDIGMEPTYQGADCPDRATVLA